jgi:hypothetical protein
MSAAPVLNMVHAAAQPKQVVQTARAEPIETLAFYRKHTEALLRRYMRKSLDIGRTPSILGNCMFRGRVSHRELRTFEDTIIFVFDVEKCLKRLDPFAREVVARIALQEYSQVETAEIIRQSLRTVVRKYSEAIDTLTGIFLEYELLNLTPQRYCQGGK